jgi:putative transposase
MARALRIEYEDAFYHVTSRGNERKKIFTTRRDYEKFKEYVLEAKKRFGFILHCYVLMSNHYHMLIETPEKNLQRIMHQINSSYSIYTNTKRKRCGHLFQGRYKAIIIDKDNYLVELSRYIHLNPVRAKVVERPEDYPYSSYRAYIFGIEEQIVCTSNILGFFPEGIQKAQSRYKSFVESVLGEEQESPLRNVYGGGILGDEDFVNEVLANIEDGRLDSENIAHRKALRPSMRVDAILAGVSEYFGVPVEEAISKNSKLRKVCVYLLKSYSDATYRSISELLGQGSYSSVAKLYTRFIKEVDGDEKLKLQLELLEAALSIVQVRPHG